MTAAMQAAEKSTLWTNTCVDQNFQRDLGAIGPYQFQEKSVWTNPSVPCFPGKSVWTNGAESLSKVPHETGPSPWMALPRVGHVISIDKTKENDTCVRSGNFDSVCPTAANVKLPEQESILLLLL